MTRLNDLRRQLDQKADRVANRVADEIVRELQRVAPIDTGELRSMIETQVRRVAQGQEIDFASNADYSEYVKGFRADWDRIMAGLPDRVARVWRRA